MDNDEPIDLDAAAESTDGRGSSPDPDKVGQGEIDLRPAEENTGALSGEVVVAHGRPAPPAPPRAASSSTTTSDADVRPAPPAAPASAAAGSGDDVHTSATNARPEPPVIEADGPEPRARGEAGTDTPLIDLGETIADERDRAPSAWWKYAVAIAVPIAVAAVLLFALAGRGSDDDLPEFTQGEGTELATGADSSTDAADSGDSANAVADPEDASAAAAGADESAATTENSEAADEDRAEDTSAAAAGADESAATTENSEAADEDRAEDAATRDDAEETRESSERAEAAPTEAPETDNDDAEENNNTTGSGTTASGSSVELGNRTMTSTPFSEMFELTVPEAASYSDFTAVEHVGGALAISVPGALPYIDNDAGNGDESIVVGTEDGAPPDAPGITVRRFTDGDLSELDDVLAEAGPGFVRDCTVLTTGYELPAPLAYEGLLFADRFNTDDGVQGSYVFYESCGYGSVPTAIVQAALLDEQGDIVLLTFQVATTADLAAIDQALSTVTF